MYSNRVSHLVVSSGCELEGFNQKNYEKLIGKWTEGSYSLINNRRQNDKMTSFKCRCNIVRDCGELYFNGVSPVGDSHGLDCKNPQCGVAQFTFIDKWHSTNLGIDHGFVAKITLPESEYDDVDGWTVSIRFPIHRSNFHGRFELFQNADIWNVLMKEGVVDAVEFVVQQTESNTTDTFDVGSFVIVGRQMPSIPTPEIFFWSHREKHWNCYNPDVRRSSNLFSQAVAKSQHVKEPAFVRNIKLKPNGNIFVQT